VLAVYEKSHRGGHVTAFDMPEAISTMHIDTYIMFSVLVHGFENLPNLKTFHLKQRA
jgi:hypothetical protein